MWDSFIHNMEKRAHCALFRLHVFSPPFRPSETPPLPPFRPCGAPSPPGGRRGGGSAPPGGGKITTPSKGTPPRRRSEEAEAFLNSPSRAGGPGEGQASTQSPRAGWELSRRRANLRNGGPRGCAAWRQRGCAESADCAHPLAILWFLSHRWERNPPRRAEPQEEA